MSKVSMIPCIYAGDLPPEVEDEMRNNGYDGDYVCFHGDGGCVFSVGGKDLKNLPLFKQHMIDCGAWDKDGPEAKMTYYEDYLTIFNLNTGEPYHFEEYWAWMKENSLIDSTQVAMTGT